MCPDRPRSYPSCLTPAHQLEMYLPGATLFDDMPCAELFHRGLRLDIKPAFRPHEPVEPGLHPLDPALVVGWVEKHAVKAARRRLRESYRIAAHDLYLRSL